MRTVSVDVYIDLDEFSNTDLIDEIKYRKSKGNLSNEETTDLIRHLHSGKIQNTLHDVLKLEIIDNYLQSHTIFELEEKLKV